MAYQFFRDVTERKRTEEERLTTSKLESLDTLAGGIAHDLNNILTVISGNIGLAQIEAPSDAGSLLSFLSKAGQAAQHAAHLSASCSRFPKGARLLSGGISLICTRGGILVARIQFARRHQFARGYVESRGRSRPNRTSR
jgi:hypothetical protein